jgi:transposase
MFPPSLDELIEEDNVVRAIEVYVDTLDIFKLNIKTKKSLIKDGQPAFHPKLLLKIYIYGYLNLVKRSGALASLSLRK